MHEVVQVIPHADFTVYVYFSDGVIKKYDASPLVGKCVFARISNSDIFMETCTVMNNTLAWDISGNRDPRSCLDIDPETIYETAKSVADPLAVAYL